MQVLCCIENFEPLLDVNQLDVAEFYINLRELLRSCESGQTSSGLGWKVVELIKHLESRPEILAFLRVDELGLVPIVAQYLVAGGAADKMALGLSVLEPLTQGIKVPRSGLWLSGLLKVTTFYIISTFSSSQFLKQCLNAQQYLVQSVLEKSDHALHPLAILSNLCLENDVVVMELNRQSRSDELLHYLMQLQATDELVQLHAAQVNSEF